MEQPMNKIQLLLFSLLVSIAARSQEFDFDQGWTDAEKHEFWHIDQGSKLMPLKWFLNLEKAGGGLLINDLEKFGFIPDPNPNADFKLPIGFAHTGKDGDWVGLTCAACHTGAITIGGRRRIIEGAPSMLDLDSFFMEVVSALHQVANDQDAWKRFSAQVPGVLQKDVKVVSDSLDKRKRINYPAGKGSNGAPVRAGHGRVDAFGQILNEVSVVVLGNTEKSAIVPNAPASFPCLWDIVQHEFVQWNGSAPNLGPEGKGSLLRNIGEVIGVFGEVTVPANFGIFPSFNSSANVTNLKRIEQLLAGLYSPSWPGALVNENDRDLEQMRSRGKELYFRADLRCNTCHEFLPNKKDRKYPLPITLSPITEVKTDPQLASNFITTKSRSMALKGKLKLVKPGHLLEKFGGTDSVSDMTAYVALGALMKESPPPSPKDFAADIKQSIEAILKGPPNLNVYKARPLNGVWATAPYLHNGSVPNLWDLLSPANARKKQFCMGDYDTDLVGYKAETCDASDPRWFDATIPGNKNSGHEYGASLSDDDKRALIQFLKTL
jgi:hypothetical protein